MLLIHVVSYFVYMVDGCLEKPGRSEEIWNIFGCCTLCDNMVDLLVIYMMIYLDA